MCRFKLRESFFGVDYHELLYQVATNQHDILPAYKSHHTFILYCRPFHTLVKRHKMELISQVDNFLFPPLACIQLCRQMQVAETTECTRVGASFTVSIYDV